MLPDTATPYDQRSGTQFCQQFDWTYRYRRGHQEDAAVGVGIERGQSFAQEMHVAFAVDSPALREEPHLKR